MSKQNFRPSKKPSIRPGPKPKTNLFYMSDSSDGALTAEQKIAFLDSFTKKLQKHTRKHREQVSSSEDKDVLTNLEDELTHL